MEPTTTTWASEGFSPLPECGPHSHGQTCFEPAPGSGGGGVVFTEYQDCQASWILLPGFQLLPSWLRIVVYFLTLVWCFFGVAIVSDVFMSAIEVITAAKKVITRRDPQGNLKTIEVDTWNPTVANLTLLALGSSAPEIMLAVIETCITLGKPPGRLGPSTIVGSAAFNLLAITAVCMLSVPEGQVRRITELPVFICTALFSILAYVWMYVVYTVWTPDEVTLEEAIITLLLCPVMVGIAYFLDVHDFGWGSGDLEKGGSSGLEHTHIRRLSVTGEDGLPTMFASRQQIASMLKKIEAESDLQSETEALLQKFAAKETAKWGRLRYRINAVRALAGKAYVGEKDMVLQASSLMDDSEKVVPSPEAESREASYSWKVSDQRQSIAGSSKQLLQKMHSSKLAAFVFRSRAVSVLESAGTAVVGVRRGGNLGIPASVAYTTVEGSAIPGEDYITTEGVLEFKPGQIDAQIEITIVDDDEPEPDKHFYVELMNPQPAGSKILTPSIEVVIVDDDEAGVLSLDKDYYDVKETDATCCVMVKRVNGSDGTVTVKYDTFDGTAIAGEDYVEARGVLTLEPKVLSKKIEIPLIPESVPEVDKFFKVRLSEPTGGATLGKCKVAHVTVVDDNKVDEMASQMEGMMTRMAEKFKVAHSDWGQQFKAAMYPDGGLDEDTGPASLVLHYVSITWKLIFALIPPAEVYGGWMTFSISLLFIAALTAIIAEFANLFGCAVGLEPEITAITFVAIGTSLPDTFASVQATRESPDADAAIGNVTGSNAVNVFLGLGIPWLIASIYYKGEYHVRSGDLGFSVLVFTALAVCCVTMLLIRRSKKVAGGELGGVGAKFIAGGLFCMWILYILLSALQVKGVIPWND